MRKETQDSIGGPEVLRLQEDAPTPEPQPGEVLIEVKAIGVNPVDGKIRPPGLWQLTRHCAAGGELSASGLRIEAHGAEQDVVLVASVPLTAEHWVPLPQGELLVAQAGLRRMRTHTP